MNTLGRFLQFVKIHPVATYYVVTLLISWGGVVIMIGGPGQISSQEFNAPFLQLYLITVAGPSIAAILLTGLYDGKQGCRALLSRLVKWKLELRWYAAAFLFAPVTVFATLFILSAFSPAFLPGIVSSAESPIASAFGLADASTMQLILFVCMIGLFNGFVEELGWTGFASARLRLHHHLIAGGLNLGIMWGLWHFLANYLGSASDAGTLPLPLYLAVLLFSFLPPFRILMSWVYVHTESLLIGILMHASLDVFWILATPVALTGELRSIWYVAWAGVVWGAVGLVWKLEAKKIGNAYAFGRSRG